jgi:hypothetical protein
MRHTVRSLQGSQETNYDHILSQMNPSIRSHQNKTLYCIKRPSKNVSHTWLQLRSERRLADWTLTHTSHKDTEQSTIEASITLDGVTLTGPLIR